VILAQRRSRIWLANHRVDFRKQHSGLLAEAYKMNLDPFVGDVVIFIGRSKRMVKVLYADATGIWVSAKKFTMEAMKTKFKFAHDPNCQIITQAELAMLTEGSAYTLGKKVAVYTKCIDIANDQRQRSPHEESSGAGTFPK
jgi:transposase